MTLDQCARGRCAPGGPGASSHGTSSKKTSVGSARSSASHVWFATFCGVVGEIFYPRIDRAAVRDLELIITDGADFFSEEKTHTEAKISWLKEGVPAFRLTNTCRQGRYRIDKTLLTDPARH